MYSCQQSATEDSADDGNVGSWQVVLYKDTASLYYTIHAEQAHRLFILRNDGKSMKGFHCL